MLSEAQPLSNSHSRDIFRVQSRFPSEHPEAPCFDRLSKVKPTSSACFAVLNILFNLSVVHRHEADHCTCCLSATELIAFPAGGIAAVVIGTVVLVMVVAKVICVITGYERRLPNIDMEYDSDEQRKHIVYEQQSTDGSSNVAPATHCDDVTSAANAGLCLRHFTFETKIINLLQR